MKKNLAVFLAAVMTFGSVGAVFAADETLAGKYAELEKADFGSMKTGYTTVETEYLHSDPERFEFKNGVISGKIADFDGDGEDELMTVYAESQPAGDALRVQMYEKKDGKVELQSEGENIASFLWGEKGGGCVFIKKVDGKDRIFMQYTGEMNSFGDAAYYDIKAFDYDGEKLNTAFKFDGQGSLCTISEKEAEEFKSVGLVGTFGYFKPYEDPENNNELGYGFSPYYIREDKGFNIGAHETDKDMLTEFAVETNIYDIFEEIPYEQEKERVEAVEKDGTITLKVTDKTDIKADNEEEKTEPEKTEPEKTEPEKTKSANEITVYIDGEELSFDAAPYIENGTTRVPMRAIFEALGADVKWDAEDKKVTAEKDGTTVELTIGEDVAYVNGTENPLLVPAEIKESRTMVPLRFVSEALGAKVDWEGTTKTITIASGKTEEEKPSVYEQDEDAYSSVIKDLKKGEAYAFAAVGDTDALLVTDYTFDNMDGNLAAIEADVYVLDKDGKPVKCGTLKSGSTSCPLTVSDDYIFTAGGKYVAKNYIEDGEIKVYESSSFTVKDEDKIEYFYRSPEDTEEKPVDNGDEDTRLRAEYGKAIVVGFKVVE